MRVPKPDLRSSRCRFVLVDEAAEHVSSPNTVERDDGVCFRRQRFDRRSLVQGAVRAMLVVMTDVDPEDAFEVPSVHDKNPVETFATYRPDPPFDEGVRARCAYGCADRPDAVGAEHFVEGRRELAVAVCVLQAAVDLPVEVRSG